MPKIKTTTKIINYIDKFVSECDWSNPNITNDTDYMENNKNKEKKSK